MKQSTREFLLTVLSGIIATIIGGVILAIIIQDARFAQPAKDELVATALPPTQLQIATPTQSSIAPSTTPFPSSIAEMQRLQRLDVEIQQIVYSGSGEWVVIYENGGATWTTNLPEEILLELKNTTRYDGLQFVAFGVNNNWVIGFHNGRIVYTTSISEDFRSRLDTGFTESIEQVAFLGDSKWIILLSSGLVSTSTNLPQELQVALNQSSETPIRSISVIANSKWIVYYENRMFTYTQNIPSESIEEISRLAQNNISIKQVVLYGETGWVILYNKNDFLWGGNLP